MDFAGLSFWDLSLERNMFLYLYFMKRKACIYGNRGMIAWHAVKDGSSDHTGCHSSSLTSEHCFLKLGLGSSGDQEDILGAWKSFVWTEGQLLLGLSG